MKPSERIIEKIKPLKPGDMGSTEHIVNAILIYLDEQAESQEPKALEEKRCDYCGEMAGPEHFDEGWCRKRDEAKPQEEPKECCERCELVPLLRTQEIGCKDKDCPCHQKETEPKEGAARQ